MNATPGGRAGDVDPALAEVAADLTPVPGGVGPVTTALLLRHVIAATAAAGAKPRERAGETLPFFHPGRIGPPLYT